MISKSYECNPAIIKTSFYCRFLDFITIGFLTTLYLSQIITRIVYYNYLNEAVSDRVLVIKIRDCVESFGGVSISNAEN